MRSQMRSAFFASMWLARQPTTNLAFWAAMRSRSFFPMALRSVSASPSEQPARSAVCGTPHDLLLVDHDPVGLLEVPLHRRVLVGDLRLAVLALDEVGDEVHGAR